MNAHHPLSLFEFDFPLENSHLFSTYCMALPNQNDSDLEEAFQAHCFLDHSKGFGSLQ